MIASLSRGRDVSKPVSTMTRDFCSVVACAGTRTAEVKMAKISSVIALIFMTSPFCVGTSPSSNRLSTQFCLSLLILAMLFHWARTPLRSLWVNNNLFSRQLALFPCCYLIYNDACNDWFCCFVRDAIHEFECLAKALSCGYLFVHIDQRIRTL